MLLADIPSEAAVVSTYTGSVENILILGGEWLDFSDDLVRLADGVLYLISLHTFA